MNARTPTPDNPADRRARHLRQCEELAELGMDLARAAAREAMRALQAPLEHRMPAMAAPPVCDTAEPGVLFTRVSRAVRQAILLEARIAAGAFDRRIQFTPPSPQLTPSPARERDDHDRESLEPLEDDLAGDAHRSVPEILCEIREQLGLPAQQQPNHKLFGQPRPDPVNRPSRIAHRSRPKPS